MDHPSLPVSLQSRRQTRTSHKHTPTPSVIPSSRLAEMFRNPDYADYLAQSDRESSEKSHKTSKTAASKQTQTTHKAAHEISNIPTPTPENDKDKLFSVGYNPAHTFSIISATHLASSSTFSPLPPLPSPTSLTTIISHPPSQTSSLEHTSTTSSSLLSSTSGTLENASTKTSLPSHSPQGLKLPVVAIALLSVGSALVLIGVFIAVKACARPTRRPRPTPSLPILDDGYGDCDFDVKEKDSPLFGGKERFSEQQAGGLWAWNQAQTNPFTESLQPAAHTNNTQLDDTKYHYNLPTSQSSWQPLTSHESQSRLLSPHPVPSYSVPALPVSHQPSRNNTFTRAVSRFSTASLSLYPTSPISAQDIGIAISNSKAFTADGHPILNRTSKAAIRRSRSEALDDKMELAYDGADVTSPKILQSPVVPTASMSGGRTRIKSSYYTPGSYPRISTIPSSTSSKIRADEPYDAYPFPPMPKSDSRRDDTRDRTSFSLDKFPPPSPQPTLYPDDSLSVVGVKRPSKRVPSKKSLKYGAGGSDETLAANSLDASTALGSLMLNMDFGATNRSLATLGGRLGESTSMYGEFASGTSTPGLATSQSNGGSLDKPPRVPSPPPLPSLAQMGLEHSDPMGYADYRSPTYSICGMYEDEKSRTSYYR